jgi:hypothetical protein
MANRFPLSLDGTAIKELPSGDNLDLTGSGISISGGQGADGQVLTSTGTGVAWENASGGGAWTRISTTNVTSAVATVEITISGSYDYYVLRYSGWNAGTSSTYPVFGMTTVGGSYSETTKYVRFGYGGDTIGGTNSSAQTGASYASVWPVARTSSTNGSAFGELHISNVAGQPSIHGKAHIIDDDQSLDLGMTNFVIGFDSPNSNDKIGKVRIKADGSQNTQAGKFVLYGIATS